MPLKRADLHMHTRFSRWKHLRIIKPRDSYNDPLDAYNRCKQAGMDFVVFTDHDTIDGALDLLSRRPELEPEVIVGEEVETYFPDTGQWIHVNVFDIDEAIHRDITHLRADVHELVGYLRQREIFHVLNHPFQSYRLQQPAPDYVERILDLFDYFETLNATQSSRHNSAVAEMLDYAATARGERKGVVGGSDAHNLHDIARCFTEARVGDGPGSGGRKEWLESVACGRGRAVGRSIGAFALTVNVYGMIGRYYLSLLEPRIRRDMDLTSYAAAAVLAPVCVAGLPAFLSLGNALRLEVVSLHLRRSLGQRLRGRATADLGRVDLLQDPPG